MDVVFDELHRRVKSYLATVKNVAADGGNEAALVIARDELPLIVDAFDALFGGHIPDDNGHCRQCHRAGRWWRRRRVPCRVFLQAQIALFHPVGHGRHALTRAEL
ncbi:hypothetical protein [Lentzea albidocapillata]|uniref:Uncharacterized protein n=1 Tax=Lentzea albidocapillata TaxID=40571 RepID=A0A1W2ERI0_9PSEU|nr:hypothetical protein [Lentzea albidocapillata]SMD12314.1 hypothetical protein SAMN05660733_04407 [Lentzea albidocapillata]